MKENIRWEKDKVYNLAIPEEFELYLERLEYYVGRVNTSSEGKLNIL